ncbi:MAG TPA: hypothetical protein VNJ52_05000 [Patescibacteria group bacterium]|nr:hypothetical protein [Patescibacteria group bacterium]
MTYAQNMKAQIIADLNTLVPATLNCVISDDFSKLNPLDRNFPGFPAALVIPPTVSTSEYEDTATNLREYTWFVMVVMRPEDLTSSTFLEGVMDAVLNVFDQDVTLKGASDGGVLPAVIEPPGPVSSGSVTYVVFYITLKARTLVTAGTQ